MRRVLTFLGVVAGTMALLAGPAAADRPSTVVVNVVGQQIVCGDVVLTVTSGTFARRVHEHPKPDGSVQEVLGHTLPEVTLVDEEGNTYRAVGATSAQFTSNPANGGESFISHLTINHTIVGERGLLGLSRERLQITRNGGVLERTTGSCLLLHE
jgi:hypothetical protein